MPAKGSKIKISIRLALILGCLGMIWGTHFLTTTTAYISSEKVLMGHARDIMENIADFAMTQSQNYLALANGAAHLTKRLINSNVVGGESEKHELLEKYFFDQLSIYPHFAGIYFGSPNGDFFYLSRNNQRRPGGFRTKVIVHTNGIRETSMRWRDKDYNLISTETDPEDTYDPRQRPWYKKATSEKRIVWTDPYIFFTSQKPGITIAGPVYDDTNQLMGVVGVDIELHQLSTFIGKLRIGKNGRAFMINNNGDVVAFPDLSKINVPDAQNPGRTRLVKIHELDDTLSPRAFNAVDWQRDGDNRIQLDESRFAKFENDGHAYHTMFTSFTNEQWPWIIGVYLPEDDYLGAIKENRRFNILITIAISVFATLIGFLVTRGMLRAMSNLEKEARAIKHNDMKSHFDTSSVYKEIHEAADSFLHMKDAIRQSQEKYQGIFENIQDVYYEATLDGLILEISPSIEKISQYRREDLIGKPIYTLYSDPKKRDQLVGALLDADKVIDYEIVFKELDGSEKYFSINSILVRDSLGKPQKG